MKEQLETALGRPLSDKEESLITWLSGWDNETREGFAALFSELWQSGAKSTAKEKL